MASATEFDATAGANDLVRKYREIGDRLAEAAFPREAYFEGDPLLTMLKMHMWNELYLGVLPPVRQIELLDRAGALRDNLDLFIRLSDHIRDEVKHSKLFSRRIEELGGNPNILEFEATPKQERLLDLMTEYDVETVYGPAATLMVCSETMLARIFTRMIDAEVVDRRTRKAVRQAEIDEGNHINNGKLVLSRFATDPEAMAHAERLGDEVAAVMFDIYRVDHDPFDRVFATDGGVEG